MSRFRRPVLRLAALEDRLVPTTFTVLNNADDGAGSFRQAIVDANAASGADTIAFDAAAFASATNISLLTALPTVTDHLTVNGPGSAKVDVRRDVSAGNFRILTIKNLAVALTVNVTGVTLSNGFHDAASQTDNGGGMYVGKNCEVTLTDVVVRNSQCTAQGGGIAVDERGRLTLNNSTVTGNQALGQEFGSPIEAFTGVGGGIYFTLDGNLTLLNSTVDNNTARVSGAGIFLYGESNGTALIRNSTISTNKVSTSFTGLVYRSGGGGIAVLNNSFGGGTGLFALTVQNSTITANQAVGSGQGGGIQASSLQANKITTRIESTVIAGNSAGSGVDIFGTSQPFIIDYSAIGSTTGFALTNGPGGMSSNQVNLSFPLGALTDNGGPTRTHLPPDKSLLLDRATNPGGMTVDQRGLSRTFDDPDATGALFVDIGAVERQPIGLPTAKATAPDITTSGGTTHTFTVVYGDETGIIVSTVGAGDVMVSGPNGYSKTASFVNVVGTGTSVTATYSIPAAGGTWDVTDAGVYTISMNANQVSDVTNNFVPVGTIGTFKVLLPRVIIVNTISDNVVADSKTSLREAITLANDLGPSNDTIMFDPVVFPGGDVISYKLGQMFITDSVTIQGPGTFKLTLDAGSASRHFNIDGPGLINVAITGLSLTAGRTTQELQSERGGSIYINGENLTLDGVNVTGNSAQKSYGGAIHLQGQASLTFKNGRLNNNSASLYGGGAISALDIGHSITISDAVMTGNTAGYYGGAIFSSGGGSVTIDRTMINNSSTTLALVDDQGGTVIRGGGGAIMVANGKIINGAVLEDADAFSSLTITNSHLDGNSSAHIGGAILFNGKTTGVTLRNTTITNNKVGNTPDNVGGGILIGNLFNGPVLFENCTFAYNVAYSGGGLFVGNNDGASVQATSTIFAQNSSADPTQLPPDVDGNLNANFCFFGVVDGAGLGGTSSDNVGNGALGIPVDPLFGFLDYNGGPTQTLPLLAGSPCLDVGSNPSNLLFDQRGVGFNRVSKGKPDIGAYELQVVAPPTVTDIKINDGSIQRSTVRSITVTFSTLVTLGGGTPAQAFKLARNGPGNPVGDVTLTVADQSTPTQTVSKLTFTGGLSNFASLINGNYTLTIIAAQVVDGSMAVMAADATLDFHRLYGDADGDRDVDSVDFVAFRQAFASNLQTFDFDDDGDVDSADFVQFRVSFGSTI